MSNISRDHIAMEAMKVLMQKTVSERISLKNRIRNFFGKGYTSRVSFDCKFIAKMSYDMADAMIEQRSKILEEKQ